MASAASRAEATGASDTWAAAETVNAGTVRSLTRSGMRSGMVRIKSVRIKSVRIKSVCTTPPTGRPYSGLVPGRVRRSGRGWRDSLPGIRYLKLHNDRYLIIF
ncbi:hypothetical protein GCM10023220_33260 [Streptomyces ziwulingensis]|uniref:Transposase n=1 Tax=Streptomyces ziwulingensis TaxID=1045501 RepID=A0ABP9BX45_9ACTN